MLLLHHGREMLGNKTSGSALKGSPPEPTSNKVWLFQNSGKFQKDLADDQSNLEETLILPVFFHAAAPKLWNDLPGSIRNTQSLNKFKKAIKTFLFAKAF